MQEKFENHADATRYWASLIINGTDEGAKVEDFCSCPECDVVISIKSEIVLGCFASLAKISTVGFTSECICSRCKNVVKR